jgi:DNA polymerase-3 subunit epsilon
MINDLTFTALDFETANWYRRSACSIGMVKVEQGVVVDEYYSLIKPTPNWFHPINSSIHGLFDDHCKDKPMFGELWPTIKDWIEGQVIVAHNVAFEKSVLNHLFIEYEIDAHISEFLCSLYLSKVAFPHLMSHKLPHVYAQALNKEFMGHHNALEDARASAEIVIEVTKSWNPPTFKDMISALYIEPKISRISPKREVTLASLVPEDGFEQNDKFKGKVFVFTGEQSRFTKEEAAQFVINHGGKANDNVTMATTTVVIGQYNPRLGQDYKSNKVKKAEELINKGQKISFMTELEFLELTKP